MDAKALGASLNLNMKCWETLLPHVVRHPLLRVDLMPLLKAYQTAISRRDVFRLRRRLPDRRFRTSRCPARSKSTSVSQKIKIMKLNQIKFTALLLGLSLDGGGRANQFA